jgi:hypothetical protein
MLVATGMLEPDDIVDLRTLLTNVKLFPRIQLEAVPGAVRVIADSEEVRVLFRESMSRGALNSYGWHKKLRLVV